MLDIVHISKSYGHKKVLDDVSFRIEPGTLTGIIGENGAGKSTLLQIVVGTLGADQGTVHRSGRMGYCPQEPCLFPTLTVEENFIYFASACASTDNGFALSARDRYEEFLLQFGIQTYRNQQLRELSGGTQQKINLLISLLHDPDICILDEPYGGFDWETYLQFWELMLTLKKNGKAILLVTHLLNDLKHVDQILTLDKGTVV